MPIHFKNTLDIPFQLSALLWFLSWVTSVSAESEFLIWRLSSLEWRVKTKQIWFMSSAKKDLLGQCRKRFIPTNEAFFNSYSLLPSLLSHVFITFFLCISFPLFFTIFPFFFLISKTFSPNLSYSFLFLFHLFSNHILLQLLLFYCF